MQGLVQMSVRGRTAADGRLKVGDVVRSPSRFSQAMDLSQMPGELLVQFIVSD